MTPEEAKKLASGNNQQYATTNQAKFGVQTNTGNQAGNGQSSSQRWNWN